MGFNSAFKGLSYFSMFQAHSTPCIRSARSLLKYTVLTDYAKGNKTLKGSQVSETWNLPLMLRMY
jgi:hypothetical protein